MQEGDFPDDLYRVVQLVPRVVQRDELPQNYTEGVHVREFVHVIVSQRFRGHPLGSTSSRFQLRVGFLQVRSVLDSTHAEIRNFQIPFRVD